MSETRQNRAAIPPAHKESTLFSSLKQAAHQISRRGMAIAELQWKGRGWRRVAPVALKEFAMKLARLILVIRPC
jgi:hypothetical protein